jgi:hypothetical protein
MRNFLFISALTIAALVTGCSHKAGNNVTSDNDKTEAQTPPVAPVTEVQSGQGQPAAPELKTPAQPLAPTPPNEEPKEEPKEQPSTPPVAANAAISSLPTDKLIFAVVDVYATNQIVFDKNTSPNQNFVATNGTVVRLLNVGDEANVVCSIITAGSKRPEFVLNRAFSTLRITDEFSQNDSFSMKTTVYLGVGADALGILCMKKGETPVTLGEMKTALSGAISLTLK